MTDKTDISPLISSAISLTEKVMAARGVAELDRAAVAASGFVAKGLLTDLVKLLEAERHRADKAQADMQFECDAHIDTAESWREWKLRAITAEEEIAALKTDIESYIRISSELTTEVEELRAKMANPVVLPNRRDSDPAILTYTDAIKAINAAGFATKEG